MTKTKGRVQARHPGVKPAHFAGRALAILVKAVAMAGLLLGGVPIVIGGVLYAGGAVLSALSGDAGEAGDQLVTSVRFVMLGGALLTPQLGLWWLEGWRDRRRLR